MTKGKLTGMKFPWILMVIFMIYGTPSDSQAAQQPTPTTQPTWVLTFEDNFDGDQLDRSKWTPRDPWGWERNNELQAYVEDVFAVKDGILRITANRGSAKYDGKPRNFISGMMNTSGLFSQLYGRFEIRCRVPAGKGLWPAFWMLPEPPAWPPEIDVFEILGHETNRVFMTHHWKVGEGKSKPDGKDFRGEDFSKEFHVFGAQWTAEAIIWTVDGTERFRSTKSIPHQPMFLLVNLAVGGNWPGAPNQDTHFPAALEVDWVRVWQAAP